MIGTAKIILIGAFSESEGEDIRRCLEALYSIREGEQPLDRDFGLNNDFLDKPLNIAKNLFALQVIEKTKKYEKRVQVKEVKYDFDENGGLIPEIYLEKGEN